MHQLLNLIELGIREYSDKHMATVW